jgi:hypothetical protein
MTIALQEQHLVWQKVAAALAGSTGSTRNSGLSAQLQFKSLRQYLATHKGPQVKLQFIPFTAEDIVTNTGYSPDVDASTLYAVYANGRRTTGTTSAFFAIHAATTNGATTTTIMTARFKAAGQAFVFTSGDGIAVETELTISAADAVGGATEATAADAADGFVLVGA